MTISFYNEAKETAFDDEVDVEGEICINKIVILGKIIIHKKQQRWQFD